MSYNAEVLRMNKARRDRAEGLMTSLLVLEEEEFQVEEKLAKLLRRYDLARLAVKIEQGAKESAAMRRVRAIAYETSK